MKRKPKYNFERNYNPTKKLISTKKYINHNSFLDSSVNNSKIFNNTTTPYNSIKYKDFLQTTNSRFNTLNNSYMTKNQNNEQRNIIDKLNHKFNSMNISYKRREMSLNNSRTNLTLKPKNNINTHYLYKKALSSFKLYKSKFLPSYSNKVPNKKYNLLNYYKRIKMNKFTKKNDSIKIKINSLISNIDRDIIPNKAPSTYFYTNTQNNSLINNYIQRNNKENFSVNIFNTNVNDMKKFNALAISKLMDINDIKKYNQSNFYDYNYNRNYKQRLKGMRNEGFNINYRNKEKIIEKLKFI